MKFNPAPYNELAKENLRNFRWAQYEIIFRTRDAMNSLFTTKDEDENAE